MTKEERIKHETVKIKVNVRVYVVVDAEGGQRSAVCAETCDDICVGGMDALGKYQQFESEAYHLEGWVKENGFTMRQLLSTIEA